VDKYSALSYQIIFHFLTDFNQFNFSKNFKIKEILAFENALKKNFKDNNFFIF